MVATIRRQETGYEALVRLAGKARKEGVQLLHSRQKGVYVATSGTVEGGHYAVTPHSCECKGFARCGRCKHIAALQTALGWIARPEETPVASPSIGNACEWCEGTGAVKHRRSRWVGGSKTGYRQIWTVDEPCPHCAGTGKSVKAVA